MHGGLINLSHGTTTTSECFNFVSLLAMKTKKPCFVTDVPVAPAYLARAYVQEWRSSAALRKCALAGLPLVCSNPMRSNPTFPHSPRLISSHAAGRASAYSPIPLPSDPPTRPLVVAGHLASKRRGRAKAALATAFQQWVEGWRPRAIPAIIHRQAAFLCAQRSKRVAAQHALVDDAVCEWARESRRMGVKRAQQGRAWRGTS